MSDLNVSLSLTNILTVNGSPLSNSRNRELLDEMASRFPIRPMVRSIDLSTLPLYSPVLDCAPLPESVLTWRSQCHEAQSLIISTPEYLQNIPASLKNALEWLTSSGELYGKKVLPITFTPHAPRGEKAMLSLLASLKALDAQIICTIALYQNDFYHADSFQWQDQISIEMIKEAISLV